MNDQWQKIETAPKDGTLIDVWQVDPSGDGERVADVRWGNTAYGRQTCFIVQDGYDEAFGCALLVPVGDGVTHWMPLPAPPVLAANPDSEKP